MNQLKGDQGSMPASFAMIAPLLFLTFLVALQILIVFSQRSEALLVAHRLANIAATTGSTQAHAEFALHQNFSTLGRTMQELEISSMNKDQLRLILKVAAPIYLTNNSFHYQVSVIVPIER